ncbi:RNA polymerase sigma70 [Streptomyces sp. MUSC 125]|uniref:sigma factor-like helix-turn-helix DNA-binding protein n=1 Tax=Streptomyces sp. MUSC 125 TaxID=1428624 RepID=UPI000580028D|nr:sigma factor-like helix-turn-helix DNA-binding protein [Streptomyces sp. MUSC 125]KIE26418.1 RNA polymerase sigma70 [Streptomyces sp. MUSC 125]
MHDRQLARGDRRAREFDAFVTGAAGRLLHTTTLLTAEAPDANVRAQRLLTLALAHTYARWHRLHGEDPYDCARRYLATRFARATWHRYGPLGRARPDPRGPLASLTAQERLVLVLRLYEGVAEEQAAALLGLPAERVHALCDRATAALLHPAKPTAVSGAGAKVVPS